jgi:Peptidase S46
MAGKQADEAKLEATFKNDPKNKDAANPWEEIAGTVKVQRDIYLPLTYIERNRAFNSELAYFARWIVRATEEKTKPARIPRLRLAFA